REGGARRGARRAGHGEEGRREPPGIPPASEAGLRAWEGSSCFGIGGPAGTPRDIVNRLAGEIARAVAQPSMQRFTTQSGARMLANTPEEFDRLIRAERTKWGGIIRAAKISAERFARGRLSL